MVVSGLVTCIFLNVVLSLIVAILWYRVETIEKSIDDINKLSLRQRNSLRDFQHRIFRSSADLTETVSSLYLDSASHTSDIYHLIRRVEKLEAKNVKRKK